MSSGTGRNLDRVRRQRQSVALVVLLASLWIGIFRPDVGTVSRPFASLVVDPNHVPAPVFGALPGIGLARAKAIDQARNQKPFRSLDDFDRRVKGIGPATIAELKPHLRFDISNP